MLSDQRPGGAISLMVCPADVVRATDQQEPSAVTLFISNPEINNLVNEQTVADLYGLSEASSNQSSVRPILTVRRIWCR